MSEQELTDIDRLVETEDRTNPDGTVNVTIEDWERSGDDVIVEFELIDSTHTERMPWPEPGGDLTRNKFYRLVQGAGLEMRNADLLSGGAARAQHVNTNSYDWKLVATEEKSMSELTAEQAREFWSQVRSIPWKDTIITGFWMVSVLGILILAFTAAL